MTGHRSLSLGMVALLSLAALGSCHREEIAAERSKLELAEVKNDLDSMFLCLQRLSDLGDPRAGARLPEIKRAIETRQQMRIALSDHDHETALIRASELSTAVPKEPESTRVLRESGQIFFYLEAARTSARAFMEDQSTEDTRSVEPEAIEPVVPPTSLTGSDLDRFWIRAAQYLLIEIGTPLGTPDGTLNRKTREAIMQFQKEHGLRTTGTSSAELVTALKAATREKRQQQLAQEQADRRREGQFYSLARAREYLAKAKALDPHFKNSVEFERLLAQAHTAAVYVQAVDIVTLGTDVATSSAQIHDSLVRGLGNTIASGGSVSKQWARVAPFIGEYKRTHVQPSLNQMQRKSLLLASYKEGEALPFVENVRTFNLVTQNAVSLLLEPTGNLIEYRTAGARAAEEFRTALGRVTNSLPNSSSVGESFDGLMQLVKSYEIYQNQQAQTIVEQNKALFTL